MPFTAIGDAIAEKHNIIVPHRQQLKEAAALVVELIIFIFFLCLHHSGYATHSSKCHYPLSHSHYTPL